MKRITYSHPKYKEIEDRVRDRISHEFNAIPIDVVEAYAEKEEIDLGEQIAELDIDPIDWAIENSDHFVDWDTWKLEFMDAQELTVLSDDDPEWREYLEENYYDKIMDAFYERENYPMWGTVFEASSPYVGEKLEENSELVAACGVGLIKGFGNLNTMLFFAGAGYDFYEAHWIPLFITLGWLPDELLKEDLKAV